MKPDASPSRVLRTRSVALPDEALVDNRSLASVAPVPAMQCRMRRPPAVSVLDALNEATDDSGTGDVACRILVRRPCHWVQTALLAYVDASSGEGRRHVCFELRAPVRLSALDTAIVLQRAIVAQLERSADPPGEFIVVTWMLRGGGVFPSFRGHLWPEADTTQTCWLRLDGSYRRRPQTLRAAEPGEILIGHRIAVATAKSLLENVAAHLEAA